ncbi:hypothetical protein L1N85_26205 [Paenibacillus alkaliterrae]|uniref:hypothetical protein n=1 Tax=Paenibacillus alkaliterrae TaxID=320909 RepID=UPI001F25BB37|nr:hypothetical protein [Paenibacillus alkaliterrae]MCF2941824.1 hypothetical protein [Paenibacillus alkaliterrae]
MVKKLTALSLAIFMVVVLAGCGSNGTNGTNGTNGSVNSGAAAEGANASPDKKIVI